jgi:hypothetical protein
MPCLAYW